MIKLNTTPINRRYWINDEVIYKGNDIDVDPENHL